MPKSKPPRKRLSRQVREEYIAAAKERAQARRQKWAAGVAVVLSLIIGVFGVTAATGGLNNKKAKNDTEKVKTTSAAPTSGDASGCPPVSGSHEVKTMFLKEPKICIDLAQVYRARIVTTAGILVADLDPRESPIAVNNFIFLARWRFYEGLPFHITKPNNYIQSGDPKGAGITGPGYFFKDDPLPEKDSYEVGDLLVAHEAPNQNGSQFLILVGDGPQGTLLPPAFPRFGKLVRGIDVATKIAADGAATGDAHIEHVIQSVEITPAK